MDDRPKADFRTRSPGSPGRRAGAGARDGRGARAPRREGRHSRHSSRQPEGRSAKGTRCRQVADDIAAGLRRARRWPSGGGRHERAGRCSGSPARSARSGGGSTFSSAAPAGDIGAQGDGRRSRRAAPSQDDCLNISLDGPEERDGPQTSPRAFSAAARVAPELIAAENRAGSSRSAASPGCSAGRPGRSTRWRRRPCTKYTRLPGRAAQAAQRPGQLRGPRRYGDRAVPADPRRRPAAAHHRRDASTRYGRPHEIGEASSGSCARRPPRSSAARCSASTAAGKRFPC